MLDLIYTGFLGDVCMPMFCIVLENVFCCSNVIGWFDICVNKDTAVEWLVSVLLNIIGVLEVKRDFNRWNISNKPNKSHFCQQTI